jgi:hypothetical protein
VNPGGIGAQVTAGEPVDVEALDDHSLGPDADDAA